MKNLVKGAVLAVSMSVAAVALADDDRPDHYKGLASPDLQTAVANFSEYNTLLEQELSGELTNANLEKIHQLTYTLEVALEKIEDELDDLADVLEKVHLASENYDFEATKKYAPAYLETARKVIK
ncbi:MAG TPA: DUF6746 family protein [Thiopseudomonas sp.]|nr:DUF6746 family protein [Thiopseudomonas sp.]